MNKHVLPLRKKTNNKNDQTITAAAADYLCSLLLAQHDRNKQKKKQITSYPNIHTHAQNRK